MKKAPKKYAMGGVVGKPAAMPAQANKAGAVRGQARAAAMTTGRKPAMAKGGMVKKGK